MIDEKLSVCRYGNKEGGGDEKGKTGEQGVINHCQD